MKWYQGAAVQIAVGVSLVVIGWAANSLLTAAVTLDRFETHVGLEGHPATIKSLNNTAVILERLVVEVRGLRDEQDKTDENLSRLSSDTREDLRDIRRALKIPTN